MAKIAKLKNYGDTIYPATIPQAVVNPDSGLTLYEQIKEVFPTTYNAFLIVDADGFVGYNSADVKPSRDAEIDELKEKTTEILPLDYPAFLVMDENGFVIFNSNYIAASSGGGGSTGSVDFDDNNILSGEYIVADNDGKNKGFPTMEIGITGTWHTFYKSGNNHAGSTSEIYYAFSQDDGQTFSRQLVLPVNVYSTGTPAVNPDYVFHLDPRLFRLDSGKYILLHPEIKNGKYQIVAHLLQESSGTLDFSTATVVYLPYPDGVDTMALAGSLVEKDGVLYVTGYMGDNVTVDSHLFIYKSTDQGLTWTVTEMMKDGAIVKGSETAMVVLGSRIYMVVRHYLLSGAGGDPAKYSPLYYTDDNFTTLQGGTMINRHFSGGNAIEIGPNKFAVLGRSQHGCELSFHKHNRQLAKSVIVNQYIAPLWDANYAWITRFGKYYICLYYTYNGSRIAYKKVLAEGINNL